MIARDPKFCSRGGEAFVLLRERLQDRVVQNRCCSVSVQHFALVQVRPKDHVTITCDIKGFADTNFVQILDHKGAVVTKLKLKYVEGEEGVGRATAVYQVGDRLGAFEVSYCIAFGQVCPSAGCGLGVLGVLTCPGRAGRCIAVADVQHGTWWLYEMALWSCGQAPVQAMAVLRHSDRLHNMFTVPVLLPLPLPPNGTLTHTE